MKRADPMFLNLLLGIIVSGIVGEAIILIAFDNKLYLTIGFAVGILYAIYSLIGINESVETSVMLSETEALKNTRKRYIRRVIVIVVLLVIFYVLNPGSPITFIIGAFSLKIATYLWPLMSKITKR